MILIYKTKKDYTKALEYAQMALPILEKLITNSGSVLYMETLGAIYTLTGVTQSQSLTFFNQ